MSKFSKNLPAVLAVLALLSVAACGGGNNSTTASSGSGGTSGSGSSNGSGGSSGALGAGRPTTQYSGSCNMAQQYGCLSYNMTTVGMPDNYATTGTNILYVPDNLASYGASLCQGTHILISTATNTSTGTSTSASAFCNGTVVSSCAPTAHYCTMDVQSSGSGALGGVSTSTTVATWH